MPPTLIGALAMILAGCAANTAPILDPERAEFCRNYEKTYPSVLDTDATQHVMTRNRIRVETLCQEN